MQLSRQSVGTYPETNSHATCQGTLGSSQLAEPPWTDPGLNSGISVRELISILKKKRRRGMNCRISSQNLASEEKDTTTNATKVSSGTLAHVFSCQYVSTVCCSQLPCGHWDSFRHIGVHAQSSVIHGDTCLNLLLSLDRSKPPRFLQWHCRVFCHTFSGCFVS